MEFRQGFRGGGGGGGGLNALGSGKGRGVNSTEMGEFV